VENQSIPSSGKGQAELADHALSTILETALSLKPPIL
jgi:hypothetical protein